MAPIIGTEALFPLILRLTDYSDRKTPDQSRVILGPSRLLIGAFREGLSSQGWNMRNNRPQSERVASGQGLK